MTIALKAKLTSSPDGLQAYFYDGTGDTSSGGYGIGGNMSYADVDSIRLKIGRVATMTGTQLVAGDDFVQYHEYQKYSGAASTVDGKANLLPGDKIVARTTALTVPTGDVWVDTGYYVYPWISTWLPTSAETALQIDLIRLGQTDIISDDIYISTYEVYVSSTASTFNATNGAQYLVESGSCTYDGSTYSAGDVFVAVDATSVVVNGSVSVLSASVDFYNSIDYSLRLELYSNAVKESGKNNIDFQRKICLLRTYLDSVSFISETGNVSLGASSQVLSYVAFELNKLSTW